MIFDLMFKSALSVSLMALTVGCASPPHVVITVPTQGASVEKRMESYEKVHGVSKHGLDVSSYQRKDHLELADGRKIYHPGDLYHAVRRGSDTDYAMELHDRYRSGSKAIRYLGAVAAGAGAIVMGVGAAFSDQGEEAGPLIVGGAAVAGGLTAIFVGGGYLDHKAETQRERAFAAYNEDLAKKLGLCIASNGTPVACAKKSAPPKAATTNPPEDPNETEPDAGSKDSSTKDSSTNPQEPTAADGKGTTDPVSPASPEADQSDDPAAEKASDKATQPEAQESPDQANSPKDDSQ